MSCKRTREDIESIIMDINSVNRFYDDDDEFIGEDSDNKVEINNYFVSLCHTNDKILYLESENMLTTRTFLKNNFDKNNLYVVSKSNMAHNKFIEYKLKHIGHMDMITYLLLISHTNIIFDSIWLDYCCTIEGNFNSKISPIDDIDIIFSRKLIKSNGIIGLTFSFRKGISKANIDQITFERIYNKHKDLDISNKTKILICQICTIFAHKYNIDFEIIKTYLYKPIFTFFVRVIY